MEGRKKEKVVFGIVCLVVAMLLMGPTVSSLHNGNVLDQNVEQESVQELDLDVELMPPDPTMNPTDADEDEKTYEMRIGPYVMELDLTEHQAYMLKKELEDIAGGYYEDAKEQFSDIIDVLNEYGIVPDEFTIENLIKILNAANYDEGSNDCNIPGLRFGEVYNTFGPHFICYISFFGMTIPFPYGIHIRNGSINRIVDFFNITDENLSELFEDLWMMSYWWYTSTHFLIGGPLGYYFSMSVLQMESNYYSIFGPFLGIYCPLSGLGIYIYEKNEPGIEIPLIDIFFAFSLVSVVQEIDT